MLRFFWRSSPLGSAARAAVALVPLVSLGACATAGDDPAEGFNRSVHSFNKGVDTAVIRPVSKAYGAAVPATIKHVVNNELRFLALPGSLANSVLQGNVERSGQTAARIWVNGTLGGLGALDPATEMGIPENREDFGQTLAVWGFESGPYLELPLIGPSNVRHTFGRIGDMALDPLSYVGGGNTTRAIIAAKRPVGIIDTRHRFSDVLDEVLYETDDSYTKVRDTYNQRRRNAILNGKVSEETLPDINSDEPF